MFFHSGFEVAKCQEAAPWSVAEIINNQGDGKNSILKDGTNLEEARKFKQTN